MTIEPSEDIEVDTADEAEAPRGARKLVVVGGGRGGVGKSLLAQGLAVYFAQLGKSVVLVDADPTGANLHAQFDLSAAKSEPSLDAQAHPEFVKALVDTNVQGLRLLAAAHDALDAPLLRGGRKAKWLARLRGVSADYVVIDAGPGHGHFSLDLMLAADLAICVTVPEPPAIETTYRFLRAAYRRRLRRALIRDRFRLSLMDRALAEIGELPSPLVLVRAFQRMDKHLADLAWAEAWRMRMGLVVNQTRVRTDLELGAWMCGLASRHYGVALDELGHIEHDDTVWLAVRRHKPLLVDSPTSKAARNVERIARRLLALSTARAMGMDPPPAIPVEVPSLYSVLGITRSSSDEEIRRAYKRQREIYATGGLAISSLLGGSQLAGEQARIDEAYDTLMDPIRRRAYDLSVYPEAEHAQASSEIARPALAAEQLMLQAELAREIGPDTEFSGALLRKVRESQGIEIGEISARTKIARTHLEAIEEEHFGGLPATVYVRGFVTELAKYLRLDPSQVQRTYMKRMRESSRG